MADSVGGGAAGGAKAGAALGSVVPGVGTVIGGAIGGIVGGIAGFFGGKSEKEKAEELMREAYAEIEAVGAPPELAREIILNKLQSEGMYTPEMEQEIDLAASKMSEIKEDQGLRDTQMSALELIKKRAMGGLNAEDRAAFEKVRKGVRSDVRGKERQIISELAQRGQAGSGAELAARLAASQAGAEQASDEGMDIAAAASRNALEAAARSGSMAGDVRAQDFDVASTKARAEDERNRFLFENSAALRARNVAGRNQAQRLNLSERQRIADVNVGQSNTELQRQRAAEESDWMNKLSLAQTKANVLASKSADAAKRGSEQSQTWQKGVGTAVNLGRDIYNAYQNEPEDDEPETDTGRLYRSLKSDY